MLQALSFRESGVCKPADFKRLCSTQRTLSIDTLKLRSFVKSLDEAINCLEVDVEEGRFMLAGGSKGSILLYDLAHKSPSPQIEYPVIRRAAPTDQHKFSIECLQWYPFDRGLFVSSGADKEMKIWDANLFVPVETYEFSKLVYSHDMSPCAYEHNVVAVGTGSNQVKLIDIRTGSSSQVLRAHRGSVYCVKWSNSLPHVLSTGGCDGKVFFWDIRMAKGCLLSLDEHNGKKSDGAAHNGEVYSVCFAEDGHHVFTYGGDNHIRMWDANSGCNLLVNYGKVYNEIKRCLKMSVSTGNTQELLFIPEGEIVRCFSVSDGQLMKSLSGHFRQVNVATYNPFTQEVYTGSNDRNLLVWSADHILEDRHLASLEEQKQIKQVTLTENTVTAVAPARSQRAAENLSSVLADNWSDSD